ILSSNCFSDSILRSTKISYPKCDGVTARRRRSLPGDAAIAAVARQRSCQSKMTDTKSTLTLDTQDDEPKKSIGTCQE
ncbi:MAG: hypothetical protein ACYTXY_43520, partial [Nostoc sp.]